MEGGGVTHACDGCLRRGHLLGFLAPWIAHRTSRRQRLASRLLALPDDELIAAAAPRQAERAHQFLERFQAEAAREAIADSALSAVCRHSPAYPDLLRVIPDPPSVLFTTATAERLAELA